MVNFPTYHKNNSIKITLCRKMNHTIFKDVLSPTRLHCRKGYIETKAPKVTYFISSEL